MNTFTRVMLRILLLLFALALGLLVRHLLFSSSKKRVWAKRLQTLPS